MPSSTSDVDALMEAFDAADAAVRELYRKLADNPDLATECEPALRELQRKRAELAHQVGVATLLEWRKTRDALRRSPVEELPTPAGGTPEPAAQPTPVMNGASVNGPALEPLPSPPSSAPAIDAPAPVSAQQLADFMAHLDTDARLRVAPRPDDRTALLSLATHVRIAEQLITSGAFEEEVERFERATTEDRQKRWREMSEEAQVRWLLLLVAWGKALEEDALRLEEPTTRVAAAFRMLRNYSKEYDPGYVHGFARVAAPKWSKTWRQDALHHLREIRPEPVAVPAKAAAKPKTKPTVTEPDSEEEQRETESDELVGWQYLDRVKGLRVALLGGEVREERRAALQEAFGFESLDWVPTDRPRQVASLAERAASGTLDFILVTKFVRHKETIAIERASQAPMLSLRHGYGVTTVRSAFDDYFSRNGQKANGKVTPRPST